MLKRPEELGEADFAALAARFAPTPLSADLSGLSPGDRAAVAKLVAAARVMDDLFLRQVWEGNEAMRARLAADESALGRSRYHYFMLNKGPWSRIDDDAPFIPGAPEVKPAGANFYPMDMGKEEFQAWIGELPDDERERAVGFYHTIRRGAGGRLRLVPFSEEYKAFLPAAATLLREAASLTTNASLARFLALRANAFLENDYFASELAWLDLDSPVEVTIGPYETYEDRLFGYKATFEAHVGLVDEAASAQLATLASLLQLIEDSLPLAPGYRNPKVPAVAPIRVVNSLIATGAGNVGVQTAAFNLPNDERVAAQKGYKRVMLKNVQQAKFERVLRPIADQTLAAQERASLDFDAFFTFILLHELAHGLGPQTARANGRVVPLREALRDLYSPVEEAKADTVALHAAQVLLDRNVLAAGLARTLYPTTLAGFFRSVRFGVAEAHGRGVALQFNYLSDAGAIGYDAATGRFAIDAARARDAVRDLAAELLAIEAEGAYARAQALLERYAVVRPEMQRALERLGTVPVDIEPVREV